MSSIVLSLTAQVVVAKYSSSYSHDCLCQVGIVLSSSLGSNKLLHPQKRVHFICSIEDRCSPCFFQTLFQFIILGACIL